MLNDLNLIYKIVWSYVKTNPGLEFDDLASEAIISYLENEQKLYSAKYDSSRGKKSTYIWHVVDSCLKTLLNKHTTKNENEFLAEEIELLLHTHEPSPEQQLLAEERLSELLNRLSPEALTVCDLVLNEPEIYLPLDKPKECRGIIFRTLRARDWSWPKIWKAFREVKEALSTQP